MDGWMDERGERGADAAMAGVDMSRLARRLCTVIDVGIDESFAWLKTLSNVRVCDECS